MRGLLLWMKGEWQLLSALTWSLILSLQPVKYSLERLAAKWSKNVLIYWAPMLEVKEWYKVRLVASYGLCCLEVSTVQCLQQWHSWREIVHPKEFLRLTPNCIWIVDVGEKLIDIFIGQGCCRAILTLVKQADRNYTLKFNKDWWKLLTWNNHM